MMMYQMREVQRAFLTPLSGWASWMSRLYANPRSPLSHLPLATRMAAGFELLHRLGKEYEKPAFGITRVTVDGVTYPVEETVETVRPFCRLLRFRRGDTPVDDADELPDGAGPTEASKSAIAEATRPAGRTTARAATATAGAPATSRTRARVAAAAARQRPTVLLVAPLSGHHATLLRDTVQTMVQDHDVYITDWIDARMVPVAEGDFHLHDYVAYVIDFLRHLGPRCHVVSVCQPTVPVMAAVSIMSTIDDPERPISMTMMGGPIDPRRSPTAVNELAIQKPYSWFESTVIHRVPGKYPGAGRLVYPGFLQHAGFVSMNPDRHAQSHWDFYLHLMRGDMQDADAHRRFYDEYNAVLDLPAQFYLETIKTVFQDFSLPKGTWVVPFEGQEIRVAPGDIRDVPLLTVEGELDDISGIGQTRAAHDLCRNLPKNLHQHYEAEGAGHYGIFSGRRWRTMVYPRIRQFIAEAEKRHARPRADAA